MDTIKNRVMVYLDDETFEAFEKARGRKSKSGYFENLLREKLGIA